MGEVFGLDEGPGFAAKAFSLDKIDSQFMKKVFRLAPNEVDVAANLPETEIYVIRAIELRPSRNSGRIH